VPLRRWSETSVAAHLGRAHIARPCAAAAARPGAAPRGPAIVEVVPPDAFEAALARAVSVVLVHHLRFFLGEQVAGDL